MKQRIVFALAGLALMSATAAHAQESLAPSKPALASAGTLSEKDKLHLFHDAFTVVRTVHQIPEPVRGQLLGNSKDPLNGMADYGQSYQVSDAVGHQSLPFRRLVLAATSPGYCLVYYELGGIAYRQMVEFFQLHSGQAKKVWATQMQGQRRPLSLPDLRTEIRAGKYFSMR